MTIKPPRLETDDTIGIIAPAGPVYRDEIKPAISILHKKGFHTLLSPNMYKKKGYLAGSDEARLEDLHSMFSDNRVKAIFCARGGYGTIRLLDRINYELIARNPKIIAGYSDITALLFAIFKKTRLTSLHGPVLRNLAHDRKNTLDGLLDQASSVSPMAFDLSDGTALKKGKASGRLLGGNLSLISCLTGTPFMPPMKGAILFIEDKGEPLFRIDRMLNHLRLAGIIDDLSGLIAGSFSNCGDIKDINKLLKDITSGLDIPVISGLQVGHGPVNKTIPIGIKAEMDTKEMRLSFLETYAT